MKTVFWGPLVGLSCVFLLTGCDSTPRERQEVARQELAKLDTAARNSGRALSRLGHQTVTFDAANRARRAVPLDTKKQKIVDQQLLGSYADGINRLTVSTVAGAYGELLRATRVRQTGWVARDWDYAQDTYRRLNAQLARIRMDLPARDELRIRAWQTEFTALRAKRTAADLRTATKK
ncbi:hypothetical protein GCM10027422_30750 [Hymenobacter arcticus]